jgi:hypothetical protein
MISKRQDLVKTKAELKPRPYAFTAMVWLSSFGITRFQTMGVSKKSCGLPKVLTGIFGKSAQGSSSRGSLCARHPNPNAF